MNLPNFLARTFFIALTLNAPFAAADVAIEFPLARSVMQTNERLPLAVVRSSESALASGSLSAELTDTTGSRMSFSFPVGAVDGPSARTTEHFVLDGRLVRPGKYDLKVTVDGVSATSPLEVYSHVRPSTYRLINWGSPEGAENQRMQGKLGYNLMYDKPVDLTEYIRAGVDVIPVNVMSGAHQMDLRGECDWSDPYVTRGGTRRVSRAALQYRTFPNFIGINFYDEPGLTWRVDPATGKRTPHGIPWQVRSYENSWGEAAPDSLQVDPAKAEDVQAWMKWAGWKLGFMDAAWREAAYGVSQVRSDLISNTQSQYGWSGFTDGYYFNVTRSLPVASGHGGYDNAVIGYFNPSYFLEMSRARDRVRPNWYLPTWYRSITDDLMRVENYLSFSVGIQGIMTPPWIEPTGPTPSGRAAIIETNKVMGRLGTIFDTMPATPRPVAMLYSLSNVLHEQVQDRDIAYVHETRHGRSLAFGYLAGLLSRLPTDTVVEEDILDGTLSDRYRFLLLTSIDFLDPEVVAVLETFIEQGGVVMKTADSKVQIRGAVELGVTPEFPDQKVIDQLQKEILAAPKRDWSRLKPYANVNKAIDGAKPLAEALRNELARHKAEPIFESDQPEVVGQRHVGGEIEYLFAINTTSDRKEGAPMGCVPVTAKLSLPDDGKSVYDAMTGGLVKELGKRATGEFPFGSGEMRVFARTPRPIGGIRVGQPETSSDFTRKDSPITLNIAATLMDDKGGLLAGSAPLRVEISDPQGVVTHDLFRATTQGLLKLALPLAANDPAGTWTVKITELLKNTSGSATFSYAPSSRNGHVLGRVRRAILLDGEEANLFRFGRTHREVTIIPGKGDYVAATKRLVEILAPWGIRATVMDVEQASRPRSLTEDEAKTWIGLNHASSGTIKPGADNSPVQSGFALPGAAILLGTPEDHPMIGTLLTERFLPFSPKEGLFPGRGRGTVAWQRDAIGAGQESVTLIAYDAAGMNEAVGSFYEAVAGIQALVEYGLPSQVKILPAQVGN